MSSCCHVSRLSSLSGPLIPEPRIHKAPQQATFIEFPICSRTLQWLLWEGSPNTMLGAAKPVVLLPYENWVLTGKTCETSSSDGAIHRSATGSQTSPGFRIIAWRVRSWECWPWNFGFWFKYLAMCGGSFLAYSVSNSCSFLRFATLTLTVKSEQNDKGPMGDNGQNLR